MKRLALIALSICFFAFFITSATAADEKKDKDRKNSRSHVVVVPEHDFEIDLRGYEEMLESLEPQLSDLEVQLQELEKLDFHELDNLRVLEDINIVLPEIPEIDIEIPPIPPIAVHIPEFDLRGIDVTYDFRSGAHRLYRDLSDEEHIRLQAVRSVARQDIDKAIPALEKIAKEDSSPAVRYEAVRKLGRFLDDERVVPVLGNIVKNDRNLTVRKKAIHLLGKSKDPRAVEILEGIVGQ